MLTSTAELEKYVNATRCLDIFTMKPRVCLEQLIRHRGITDCRPKQVSLALNPPTLPFTRVVRFASDLVIRFTPSSINQEVVHERGHIFLLTDLLLVCERVLSQDQDQHGLDGNSFWLLYPPLAARHLRVAQIQGKSEPQNTYVQH